MKELPFPADKIMTIAEAVRWRETLRREGRRLAVTNGCFDILHRGHADYLDRARRAGDALLVLLNSDRSVRELKGPDRPVNDEAARAFVLAALAAVDAVVVFGGRRCTAELAALRPDIYVKGGDYTVESLDPDERGALIAAGSEFCFIPFVEGFSTTATIRKMRAGAPGK